MIKTFIPRLAEIGKIKIGGKGEERQKKGGTGTYRLPKKYNHFVITKTEKDAAGNFIKDTAVMQKLGNEPKEIDIILPYDSIELNFPTSFSYYHGRRCICRGDGEIATRTGHDKKPKEIKCENVKCEYLQKAQCKPSGTLSSILPAAENIGGVYKLRTHSWNSVQNIQSSLQHIKTQTAGHLAGIPLKLQILKKHTEEHGNVITLNVVFPGNTKQLEEAVSTEIRRREQFKLDIGKIEQQAITAGVTADNDDPGDVEDEFYTEAEKASAEMKASAIDADAFTVSATEAGIVGAENVSDDMPDNINADTPEKKEDIAELL
jgi:hypothetical protein